MAFRSLELEAAEPQRINLECPVRPDPCQGRSTLARCAVARFLLLRADVGDVVRVFEYRAMLALRYLHISREVGPISYQLRANSVSLSVRRCCWQQRTNDIVSECNVHGEVTVN